MRDLTAPDMIAADLDSLAPCILSPEQMELCLDAAELLERAEDRAARWEEAARGRYATTLNAARRAGHEAGIAAAKAEIADLRANLDARLRQEEARARDLATEVLQALFEGLDDATRIGTATRRALAENPRAGGGRLTVHPRDAPDVALHVEGIADLVTDPALAPGVGRLETTLGTIHLSTERQMAMAVALLQAPDETADRDAPLPPETA